MQKLRSLVVPYQLESLEAYAANPYEERDDVCQLDRMETA
jgi:hypothetical protein